MSIKDPLEAVRDVIREQAESAGWWTAIAHIPSMRRKVSLLGGIKSLEPGRCG